MSHQILPSYLGNPNMKVNVDNNVTYIHNATLDRPIINKFVFEYKELF